MVNPTFSLGTYSFANLRAFLENRADQLHRPHAARRSSIATGAFWLAGGYVQDEFPVHRSR